MTTIVCGICIVVYILQLAGVISFENFAIVPQLVKDGQLYRIVTGQFMHASLYHIFGNLTAFYNIGLYMAAKYGQKRYALILLSSLLGSGLMITFFGQNIYTVGLSGVVWGVFGAFSVYLYKEDNHLDTGEIGIIARMLVPNIIISFLPGVSWQGHLGGFIGGLIASMILPLKWR